MQVWQHIDNMDHLRRRAEGMINAARGSQASNASLSPHYNTSLEDAQKVGIKDTLQANPGLLDFGDH